MSLRDLSAAMNELVTAQAIGKYERDESMPGSAVLLALSAALDVSIDYLLSQDRVALESVDFRKKASAGKREEAQVQAKVLHRLEHYLAVEEALGLDSATWDRPDGAPYPIAAIAEAEQAALRVREAWHLGGDPVTNLVELLEARGMKVICEPLADPIDGMTAHVRRTDGAVLPVIVVNASHHGERQRFTLGHELAHAVLEPHQLSDAEVEKAAHWFAGAFLMPAEILWREIGRHRTSVSLGELFALKTLLGVSVQALAYRCKDLGIFSQPLMRRLYDEFEQRGWRAPPYEEPFAIAKESATRLRRLCFRAVGEGALSASRAAEALGMSVRELDRAMAGPWEDQASP
jgi:Zn-dependent peptidase ImmA (M78 family)